MGREYQVRTLTPNFTVMALKMWDYSPQIAKNGNFWYKFAPKGYIPLSNFYEISPGEDVHRPHPHTKFHCCSFNNVALRPQK